MQAFRCQGVMPAKASLDVIVGRSSPLLRHCTGRRASDRVVKLHKPCTRPFSGNAQQGKAPHRSLNLVAAASAEIVPLDKLLEVAERAAKAGAAVSGRPYVHCICDAISNLQWQQTYIVMHSLKRWLPIPEALTRMA